VLIIFRYKDIGGTMSKEVKEPNIFILNEKGEKIPFEGTLSECDSWWDKDPHKTLIRHAHIDPEENRNIKETVITTEGDDGGFVGFCVKLIWSPGRPQDCLVVVVGALSSPPFQRFIPVDREKSDIVFEAAVETTKILLDFYLKSVID
jgi:hypothetical protein